MSMDMKLKNKTILITGGAGNIGSYIVEEILNQNPIL
jgi:FlaA1/EpsC-like NDP-sugar epimerase